MKITFMTTALAGLTLLAAGPAAAQPDDGGPAIDLASDDGDPGSVDFPRALADRPLDLSFSGLKTAVVNYVREHHDPRRCAAEYAAAARYLFELDS